MALAISPDLFDRIIDVTFYGESFEKKTIKIPGKKYMTKEEFDAQTVTYTQPTTGNVIKIYPDVITKGPNDQGPYEVVEETEEINVKKQLSVLECGPGLKPMISISFRMLPGQLVYHVTLKVTNLELPFDIRSCTLMHIKAGYRDSRLVQSFNMGVFTSYIESPGPDDVTVFEGIIVNSLDNFFTTRYVEIRVKEETTVENLIESFEKYLPGKTSLSYENMVTKGSVMIDSGVTIYRELHEEVLKAKVALKDFTKTFSNGYAALNWLVQTIQDATQNITVEDKKVQIFAAVFKDNICIMDNHFDKDNSKLFADVNIPIIDNIKRASFSGPLLTVIASWYPPLEPGMVFEMEPNFFNGHSLPNYLEESIWKPKDKYYRVITMEVNYDTVGSQNEMIVTALPTTKEEAIKELEDQIDADVLEEMAKEATEKVTIIEVGEDNKVYVTERLEEGDVPDSFDYKAVGGSEIYEVARLFYGPFCENANDIDGTYIDIPPEDKLYKELNKYGREVSEHDNRMSSSLLFWSLIYVATYREMQKGSEESKRYFVPGIVNGRIISIFDNTYNCALAYVNDGLYVKVPKIKPGDFRDALAPFKDMASTIRKMHDMARNEIYAGRYGHVRNLHIMATLLENL